MKYFDLLLLRPSPNAPLDPDVLLDASTALDIAAALERPATPAAPRGRAPAGREQTLRRRPLNRLDAREERPARLSASNFASLADAPPPGQRSRNGRGPARSRTAAGASRRHTHPRETPSADLDLRGLLPVAEEHEVAAPIVEEAPPAPLPAEPEAAAAPLPEPANERTGRPPALTPISEEFRALGTDAIGLEAVAALGFTRPSPIQEAAIPLLYEGHDVVGLAQTGTGKTIAFGLPLARTIRAGDRRPQALVMVPTRELAQQVRDVLDHLGRFYGFGVIALMGGRKLSGDFTALARGAEVIVGTPGRVIDHIKRGTLNLGAVHFVVLDEADEMLDIGFARDIDYILRSVPRERQTALFSATMPESIGRLVWRFMRDARRVQVAPEQRTAEGVTQYYCEVAERDKFFALRYLYENMDLGRSLIFRRTKVGVDRLADLLRAAGVAARAIHGDLGQAERDRVMADFRSGEIEFLVATNVAARGLDIPDIQHVINYDVPQNPEEYIHRIGRTARAGRKGTAVTLVGEWELAEWDAVVNAVGKEHMVPVPLPSRWE